MKGIELLERVESFGERTAIRDWTGNYTYLDLARSARFVALNLLGEKSCLAERRVAFLVPPGFVYAAVKLGIWAAGGISVPLCPDHSPREMEHVAGDSEAETVVFHPGFSSKLEEASFAGTPELVALDDVTRPADGKLPLVDEESRAMILYTSGTTSEPKGVVTTHSNVKAQITAMTETWKWTEDDSILNVLPLHHLHGILNVLLCSLWSGARCEMMRGFSADAVWDRFERKGLTLFMAVPTIYSKLVEKWESSSPERKKRMSDSLGALRLMVSGSAALAEPVFKKWEEISGHRLLERYGMTEIGMALSNPYEGPRVPGSVGFPMPGVEAGIFDGDGAPLADGSRGEIRVRGDSVFLEYWGRPEETKRSFSDGWFRTGDIAEKDPEGRYRILGRESVDIIKSGGYKISALEIERVLSGHPLVVECAVVGVPDRTWGEKVAAAIVLTGGSSMDIKGLRDWASRRLAGYKLPAGLALVEALPRNSTGKVVKDVVKRFFKNGL